MTLRDLINFCMTNGVEVSLGFDPHTEFITLKMRRGNNFQVDYNVVNPDDVTNYGVWEEMFKSVLNGMLRLITERERQRDATKEDLRTSIRELDYRDRQDAQFQRYISDVTRPNQSTHS